MSTDAQISAAILFFIIMTIVGTIFIWKKLTEDNL